MTLSNALSTRHSFVSVRNPRINKCRKAEALQTMRQKLKVDMSEILTNTNYGLKFVCNAANVPQSNGKEKDASEITTKGRKARLHASRAEKLFLDELEKPLSEYMALPVSQYSVLDAERIERLDETTFKCYAHRIKFFAFEICPVLTVKVEETSNGCCIRLLSCTLEGSDLVKSQNEKFSASMRNDVSWEANEGASSGSGRILKSETELEVILSIPAPFAFLSPEAIEATGNQVLGQVLRLMVPRFLEQLAKDYQAWATGDTSRKPLGTGKI